ncbi:MBL fold metallo-hydrolase [Streptomyces sp. P3]|uniref:rhodanese-like domain-containing protein n=1 Tax=Streptomyces sp. P3 TaxID=2135430 RepID=UPI000D1BB80D|nr:rhodanese-like domain-containing protein [Streptomyces sp. P3]AVV45211.1 MBL fold metallo-hydrolase [Streptomyces sp. P3]
MTPDQVTALTDLQLLDIREIHEWNTGRIPGSRHIPMDEVPDRLGELDPGHPVLVICRSGRRADRISSWLGGRGYDARTLTGGIVRWQRDGGPLEQPKAVRPLTVEIIETPGLGNRSYLAHDGHTALVVDPQRDTDRIRTLLDRAGVRLSHAFETHVHNDYVTGGLELARSLEATYVLPAAEKVSFGRLGVVDGEVLDVGSMRMRVVATPGHTHHHVSYLLTDAVGDEVAVFTGGSMLYGTTGRTDLLGSEHTEPLARSQHASVRRLATEAAATTRVLPTHGFGSFCAATPADGEHSTIGRERERNPALLLDEDAYVSQLLAGLSDVPAWYARMAPVNRAGPSPADLTPPETAAPQDLHARTDAGEWVVDLRDRTAYARRHLPGSLSFELSASFLTHLGWLLPEGMPLTLVGETPDQVAEAQRELVRIGIDELAGAASGPIEALAGKTTLASLPRASYEELARARERTDVLVLDVRRTAEHADGVVHGSVPIPLHELLTRRGELPPARQIWVHCASGYRATVAASLLAAHGYDVVLVDGCLRAWLESGSPGVEASP